MPFYVHLSSRHRPGEQANVTVLNYNTNGLMRRYSEYCFARRICFIRVSAFYHSREVTGSYSRHKSNIIYEQKVTHKIEEGFKQ